MGLFSDYFADLPPGKDPVWSEIHRLIAQVKVQLS